MRAAVCLFLTIFAGCKFTDARQQEALRQRLPPPDLVDPAAAADPPFVNANDLVQIAEKLRLEKQQNSKPARTFNILAISGGGNYGAYCAGVLCGWTCSGTRPQFDVVTGISTGALVATLAFLGPEYDGELKRFYTTLRNDDIFKMQRPLQAALFKDSIADNSPLARQIDAFMTEDAFQKIAAAHNQGRRLYVGTTNIETKRLVTWDMGAIAQRSDAHARKLFKQILLASAAIPGFFPPVTIDIAVDGRHYQELHVDGGATSAFIVRSPPEVEGIPHTLAGSNLYIMLAGKMYADQDAVRRKTYIVAANAISSLLYAITRSQLNEAYSATMLLGMNYHSTAIPQDYTAPQSSTDFDPVEMRKMFDEGYRLVMTNQAWRKTPPILEETPFVRKRTNVFLVPGKQLQSTAPPGDAPLTSPLGPVTPPAVK